MRRGAPHARSWLGDVFDWYAYRHHHAGLALFTPADVFLGGVADLAGHRQHALDAAYVSHPERFVKGRPTVRLPPVAVGRPESMGGCHVPPPSA